MQALVVLWEPESQLGSVGASGAMAAQCCIVIGNCSGHVGDVVDARRCAGVRRRQSEVRREIGEKCGILSQYPPPRVHVLMDLLACPPPSDRSLALVEHVGSVWRLRVLSIKVLFEVQVLVTFL